MRSFLLLGAVIVSLAGCAAPASYGNFANGSDASDKAISADAVAELVTQYPPAQTRINLGQATPDAFGATFISALRTKGYAVAEFNKPQTGEAGGERETLRRALRPLSFRAPVPVQTSVDMRYVVDQLGTDNLYRITLWLGNSSISRAYVASESGTVPAGSWVRKE